MLETAPEYCDCIEKKYTLYERVDVMRQILFFSLFFFDKKNSRPPCENGLDDREGGEVIFFLYFTLQSIIHNEKKSNAFCVRIV